MKFENLLTIVDKPKHPQVAIARTRRLLRASGGKARLAAYCWNTAVDGGGFLARTDRSDLRHELIKARKAWLEDTIADMPEFANAHLSVQWSKDIARSVAGLVPKLRPDLIVKSIHQSRTLTHTPLDWELLRSATVPVLLASTHRRRHAGVVLAAIDVRHMDRMHQPLNRRVLEAAHALAALEGSLVHVVTAIDLPSVLADLDVIDKRTYRRRARETATSRLDELLAPWNIPASRRHMPGGKVGQAVTHVARSLNADVLVVGIGVHRLRRLVGIGNSAERILQRAQSDVLAVPA